MTPTTLPERLRALSATWREKAAKVRRLASDHEDPTWAARYFERAETHEGDSAELDALLAQEGTPRRPVIRVTEAECLAYAEAEAAAGDPDITAGVEGTGAETPTPDSPQPHGTHIAIKGSDECGFCGVPFDSHAIAKLCVPPPTAPARQEPT